MFKDIDSIDLLHPETFWEKLMLGINKAASCGGCLSWPFLCWFLWYLLLSHICNIKEISGYMILAIFVSGIGTILLTIISLIYWISLKTQARDYNNLYNSFLDLDTSLEGYKLTQNDFTSDLDGKSIKEVLFSKLTVEKNPNRWLIFDTALRQFKGYYRFMEKVKR